MSLAVRYRFVPAFRYLVQSTTRTGLALDLLFSIAYWSTAESIRRRSLMTRLACERLRARRNPGTAMAASKAMIATPIMISTRVKPARRLLSLFNMLFAFFLSCLFDCDPRYRPRMWPALKQ